MKSDLLRTTVAQALSADPRLARVFLMHGMACVGCPMAAFETIEEVARTYRVEPATFVAALRREPKGHD